MKMKRIRQGLFLTLVTGLFYVSSAMAVPEFFICDIVSIGAKDRNSSNKPAKVIVTLDDSAGSPAFTKQEFKFPDRARKEMMATVLTALTNGFQVEVLTDLDTQSKQPLITEIHIVTP